MEEKSSPGIKLEKSLDTKMCDLGNQNKCAILLDQHVEC